MKVKNNQRRLAKTLARSAVIVIVIVACITQVAKGQTLDNDRRRGVEMLDVIKKDIQKNYYDTSFRGIDLDAHFKTTVEKVKAANSIGEIFGIIVRALMDFNDSHTGFILPAPADRVEQGWALQMIGDKCYVVAVKPGSDAEGKNLRPGDEILLLGDNAPTRDVLWKLWYFLRYQPGISMVVRGAGGESRALTIMAKIRKGKAVYNVGSTTGADRMDLIRQWETEARLFRHRYVETDQLLIWRMPSFDGDKVMDDMMDKAKNREALILDLRGNPGGLESALLRLTGYLFDHDIKLGDIKSRTETKPLIAKTRGVNRVFKGKLVVMVDSESGSSAEILARIVQLEKRGTVIGDRTSGSVMRALEFEHKSGLDRIFYYGVSVTIADLILPDGKTLERVGVTPDELLLPLPADLAAGRDTVLSRAANLVGFKLEPEKAGSFFPLEWRP